MSVSQWYVLGISRGLHHRIALLLFAFTAMAFICPGTASSKDRDKEACEKEEESKDLEKELEEARRQLDSVEGDSTYERRLEIIAELGTIRMGRFDTGEDRNTKRTRRQGLLYEYSSLGASDGDSRGTELRTRIKNLEEQLDDLRKQQQSEHRDVNLSEAREERDDAHAALKALKRKLQDVETEVDKELEEALAPLEARKKENEERARPLRNRDNKLQRLKERLVSFRTVLESVNDAVSRKRKSEAEKRPARELQRLQGEVDRKVRVLERKRRNVNNAMEPLERMLERDAIIEEDKSQVDPTIQKLMKNIQSALATNDSGRQEAQVLRLVPIGDEPGGDWGVAQAQITLCCSSAKMDELKDEIDAVIATRPGLIAEKKSAIEGEIPAAKLRVDEAKASLDNGREVLGKERKDRCDAYACKRLKAQREALAGLMRSIEGMKSQYERASRELHAAHDDVLELERRSKNLQEDMDKFVIAFDLVGAGLGNIMTSLGAVGEMLEEEFGDVADAVELEEQAPGIIKRALPLQDAGTTWKGAYLEALGNADLTNAMEVGSRVVEGLKGWVSLDLDRLVKKGMLNLLGDGTYEIRAAGGAMGERRLYLEAYNKMVLADNKFPKLDQNMKEFQQRQDPILKELVARRKAVRDRGAQCDE